MSCSKGKFKDNDQVKVLGHGGMGISSIYPLNSYESILNCLALGAEGTEIDVQLTKDGILVAYHNRELSDKTNKTGLIHEQDYEDIKDATYELPLYADYKLANLTKLFEAINLKSNQTFFLDCKNYNLDTTTVYVNTYVDALINLTDRFNLADNIIFEFKRTDLITAMQAKRPDLEMFAFSSFEQGLAIANEFNLKGITISIERVTEDQIEKAHSEGVEIAVYNTRTKQRNIEAIEIGADYIQTDRLKHLLDLTGK